MKPYEEQTYYELLEVSPGASAEEIRAAYERAQAAYAPDSVALYALEDPSIAEALRSRIDEAFSTLADVDRRADYDAELGTQTPHPKTNGAVHRAVAAPIRHEEPEQPRQLAMAEILSSAHTVHSTHPEYSVSYIPRMPKPTSEGVPVAPASPPPPHEPEVEVDGEEASGVQLLGPGMPFGLLEEPVKGPLRLSDEEEPRKPASRALESAPQMAQETALSLAQAHPSAGLSRLREARPTPATEAPRPRAVDLSAEAEINGELLRRVRESRGWTVQQLAERTRISLRHLENIEADRYAELPATVYLRGFLTSVAREFGLDPVRVAKSYLGLVQQHRGS